MNDQVHEDRVLHKSSLTFQVAITFDWKQNFSKQMLKKTFLDQNIPALHSNHLIVEIAEVKVVSLEILLYIAFETFFIDWIITWKFIVFNNNHLEPVMDSSEFLSYDFSCFRSFFSCQKDS